MQICGLDRNYVDPRRLKHKHEQCLRETVQLFQNIHKMGCEEKIRIYQQNLECEINQSFARYDRLNSAKKTISNYETLVNIAIGIGIIAIAATTGVTIRR